MNIKQARERLLKNPEFKREYENQQELDAMCRVIANEVYGYSGSDPNNPPIKGLEYAVATLEEYLDHKLTAAKLEERGLLTETIKRMHSINSFAFGKEMIDRELLLKQIDSTSPESKQT